VAIPATPTNFLVQQGNSEVFLSWNISAGATSYQVQRSLDGVTYTNYAVTTPNNYLDTAVTVGTQYFYQVAAVNVSGTSQYTVPASVVPTVSGEMTLGQIRLLAQQEADRVNSNFVSTTEWNSYINQSYFELYDLLVQAYEEYYVAPALMMVTDGVTNLYPLPNGVNYNGAPPFYKLMGIDCGLDNSGNAWVTLKKFNFIARNRYVYPNISSTFLGVFNLQYRLLGNNIELIPTPSANQILRIWYIPRLVQLLQDTDIADGISGWTEYVVVDAAIKALAKEESDTSVLMARKEMIKRRIEESAPNRDVGQPDTISNTRSWGERWGTYGGGGFDGSFGGF
jgi:hypothetical protein